MNTMTQQNLTPEEITKRGEEIYFNELKGNLEKNHSGEYLVMEITHKDKFINRNLITALTKARKKYPDKIFYIIQIGLVHQPAANYSKANYAWIF